MRSRQLILLVCMVVAVASLLGASFLIKQMEMEAAQAASLPALYPAPEFDLTDSRGEPLSSDDLAGSIYVANFMFTSCQGICPPMTRNMQSIYQEFEENPELRFLSISVDPENDTPEALAEFMAQYGADPARWHFVTGPMPAIQSLSVEGYKVGNLDNPIDHSARFVLVDADGAIRGYYDGLDSGSIEELKADIRALLAE